MDAIDTRPNSSGRSLTKAKLMIENSILDRDSGTKSFIDYPGSNDDSSWSDSDTLLASSVASLDGRAPEIVQEPVVDSTSPEDVKPEVILSSLCITDPATAILSIPQPSRNTCSWILKHPKYLQWRATKNSLLWIEAPSGYGKSVLANFLVNELKATSPCYFFCDSNTKDRNNRQAVLRNIIYNLMLRHSELPSHAKAAYHKLGQNFSQSLNTLIKIFKSCSQDPKLGDVVIIIDGLDECFDFQDSAFLDWITSTLQPDTPNAMRFIVTSRPSRAVPRVSSSTIIHLLLDTEALPEIGRDVQLFVDTTVSELPNARKWTSQDRLEFVNELKERSKDTFLWAKLFLKELQSSKELSLDSARALLKCTPNGVPGMYQRIFDKVPEGDHEKTKFLLQMIIAAHHPLKVQELDWLYAVHTSKGQGELADECLTPDFQTYLRDLCGSFVTVIDGKVLLQHKSAKDFVTASSGSGWYLFTEEEAKVNMVQCCIWRLRSVKHLINQMGPKERSRLDKATVSHSGGRLDKFLVYALSQWVSHFNEIQRYADSNIIQQVRSLYEEQDIFHIWMKYYWSRYTLDTQEKLKQALLKIITPNSQVDLCIEVRVFDSEPSASMVRMASHVGHVRVFGALIDFNPSLFHATFDDGWTALCTAIQRHQVDMVHIILKQNVDPNAICKECTPLNYAAAHSNPQLAKALLAHGAAVNATSVNGMTALHRAAIFGHVEVVKTLLEADANPNLVDVSGKTALHHAGGKGRMEVVKTLLDHQADPEARDAEGRTSIVLAAEHGHQNVVELLLEKKHPENTMGCHELVLHAAMRSGKSTLIKMLLDIAAIDIQTKDGNGLSAFAYALPTCDIGIVNWFLEHGADLDERNRGGTTLLHRVATEDLIDSAKSLVAKGADVGKTTKDGRTALHCAAAGRGHEPMFRLLLDSGASMEAKDGTGHTPFHLAVVQWRSQTTLRILKSLTADVETRNLDRETPLQTAVRTQNAGLVLWLLLNGGDARHDVLSAEGYPLHELNRATFGQNLDEIMCKDSYLKSYPMWRLLQRPIQDDNAYQNFTGTVFEALVKKNQLIKGILQLKGASGDGQARPMRISFPPTKAKPPSALLNVNREVTGEVACTSDDQTTSLDQKEFGSTTDLTSASVVPRETNDEEETMAELADVPQVEEGAGHIAGINTIDNCSRTILPATNNAATPMGRSTTVRSEAIDPIKSINEEQNSEPGYESEEMRGISDNEPRVQDIPVTVHDDAPQTPSTKIPLYNNRECSTFNGNEPDCPLLVISNSPQRSAEESRDTGMDKGPDSPNFVEISPSSRMRVDSPDNDSSGSSQHTPPESDDSFLSNNDGSCSDSSGITDSSDEIQGGFVPSLEQLSRAIAPELALSLEAMRRAISEILFRLSATSGIASYAEEASSCADGSGSPQPDSLGSSSSRGNSKQTRGNGKAPLGNGSNEKRGMSNGGMGNGRTGNDGEDNEDEDKDDWSMRGKAITRSSHCPCCRYSRGKSGTSPNNYVSANIAGIASLKFACPYLQHNSESHYLSPSCRQSGWPSISRLKEHIYRRHLLPIRCLRCGKPFADEALLSTHSKQTKPCDPDEPEDFEGCSKEQEKKLRSRKRPHGVKDGDRWRHMYCVLFPDVLDADIPSPYHQIPYTDPALILKITSTFCQFFKDKFPTDAYGFANVFEVAEIVDGHTNEILREYQEMRALSQAASSESHTTSTTGSILAPRKRLRPMTSQTTGVETPSTGNQSALSEHRPQSTDSSLPFRLHDQCVPQIGYNNESAVSSMRGHTNQSQWGGTFTSSSFASQGPRISEVAANAEKYKLINPSSPSCLAASQSGEDNFDMPSSQWISPQSGLDFPSENNIAPFPPFSQEDMPMFKNSSSSEADDALGTTQESSHMIGGAGEQGFIGAIGSAEWHVLGDEAIFMGNQRLDMEMWNDPAQTSYGNQ